MSSLTDNSLARSTKRENGKARKAKVRLLERAREFRVQGQPCEGPQLRPEGLFVCPEFLPDKTNLTLRNRNCARYAFSAFPLGLR
jgi:hypothetical protein